MRRDSILIGALGLVLTVVGCATPQRPCDEAAPAGAGKESAPAAEEVVESVPMPTSIEEAVVEGFVVCRRDDDIRIIGIRELNDGQCMLLYDNRLSGNGTQNILPNKAACELQQLRMKQNFVRAGLECR